MLLVSFWPVLAGHSCLEHPMRARAAGGREGTRAGLLLGWGEPKLHSKSLRKVGESLKESEGSGESRGRS